MNTSFRFFLLTCLLMMASTAVAQDDFTLKTSVTRETVSKQVAFTYKTETKTLDVSTRYVLEAEQIPCTTYAHAVLAIPFTELTELLGTTVSTANMSNMTYFPLSDGTYGHNNDNWYDSNGYRSSWSGESRWFIQPVTDDASNYTLWTGQAGSYNNAWLSKVGDVWSSTFYVVNGTTGVELSLTLKVVAKVDDVPEWVHQPATTSIANVRDLGGWPTERGETVQYGKLFRGTELNGTKFTINDADSTKLHDELGIRAELDLRKHGEAQAITASPLGSDVAYLRVVNEPYYVDGARIAFANYRNDFNFILQHLRSGEPTYFHCIWGADRTGTLAFLLEGMLGLSEDNLYQEYELTQLSNPEGELRTRTLLATLMAYVKTFDGQTLQQQFLNYWHQRAGIPLADLNDFCQIMLGTTTDYVSDLPAALDNLAYDASTVEASFTHGTTDLYAICDGIVGFGELAEGKEWNSWDNNRPASQWLRYEWTSEQTIERVRLFFWTDTETPGDHVAVPASWKIEYWDAATSTWKEVRLLSGESYTCNRNATNSVRFTPVTTTQLRLTMQALSNGSAYSALGVSEWEALGHRNTSPVTYGDYPIQNVDFSHVHLNDTFWQPRMVQNQTVTIPVALQKCEQSNRMLNFQKAAAILRGENIGYFDTECTFDDTDIYKILEGMAYSIQTSYSKELDDRMDELIALVASAQEPDGYLYTPRTAGQPGNYHAWVGENRWEKDPDLSHELYNSGHLFEAATAHYISTGKTSLLDVAIKNADLLVRDFLYGGLTYEPGHQIVEMGLVKMYRATGKEDYLRLAKYFLDLRGRQGVMRQEYSQTVKPVTMQDEAVGHAVRAAYMYSGMADVAALTGDAAYLSAIDRIWSNVVEKKYYITGGIGARHAGEAFGANYELPNQSAYCETCAAIANVYWNWRMFLLHGDSKYYDVVERTLYNGVISGIQLDGTRFFYPNPLASDGTYERSEWFGCACCPSNLCRFIASVPGYMYAHKDNRVYVNLYAQGTADIDLGSAYGKLQLTQTTAYPWQGDIQITLNNDQLTDSHLALMLRLPGWAKGQPVPSDLYGYVNPTSEPVVLKVNGVETAYTMQDGYMMVERDWQEGDVVSFSLPMDVHRTVAHDSVADDAGLVSLERGPLVYCMEWPDQGEESFTTLICNDEAAITAAQGDLFGGQFAVVNNEFTTLTVAGQKLSSGSGATTDATLRLSPSFAWANRGKGLMQVWMPRTAAKASVEAYPVNVAMSDIEVVGTSNIDIDFYPVSDGWATHSLSGIAAGADVPAALSLPITSFTLNMMYAPTDDAKLCRTKNASDNHGFWYQTLGTEPGLLYNQTTWNEAPARIFVDVEGFYWENQTLNLKFGQRPGACLPGTYTAPLYMLAPAQAGSQQRAYRFNLRFNLHPATISESADYSVEQANITAALFHRTLKADMHNTLVLPFALTQAQAEQVFGAGSELLAISRYADGVLQTEPLASTTAHVPFLLIPTVLTDDDNYHFTNILTVSGTAGTKNFTGGSMTGSYAAATTVSRSTVTGKENYVFSNDRFYLVGEESGTMQGTRAYLVLDTEAAGGEAKPVVRFEGDDPTAISLPPRPWEKGVGGEAYDLQGRRVDTHPDRTGHLPRGLYIVGGRKVLVK